MSRFTKSRSRLGQFALAGALALGLGAGLATAPALMGLDGIAQARGGGGGGGGDGGGGSAGFVDTAGPTNIQVPPTNNRGRAGSGVSAATSDVCASYATYRAYQRCLRR